MFFRVSNLVSCFPTSLSDGAHPSSPRCSSRRPWRSADRARQIVQGLEEPDRWSVWSSLQLLLHTARSLHFFFFAADVSLTSPLHVCANSACLAYLKEQGWRPSRRILDKNAKTLVPKEDKFVKVGLPCDPFSCESRHLSFAVQKCGVCLCCRPFDAFDKKCEVCRCCVYQPPDTTSRNAYVRAQEAAVRALEASRAAATKVCRFMFLFGSQTC